MISWANSTRHLWPNNYHLVQSVGGLEDSLIDKQYAHSVIFSTHKARKNAAYADASETDFPAYSRLPLVGLVYHGVANLKAEYAGLLDKRFQIIQHRV
jgi:hypothetical protein